ncbi:HD domain-containing protein [Algibacter amylolyticus]|uniref:HD domain-containing protein n=1 Tax=Algibacter amylolyticus TaxID=1608400 RepID=A0A5M7BF83_9FLAO|nr:Pycsar system effector family protein [Algibacter amylolyticus]KAA5828022.1 HD domain-containing protein [Algibacter amylolyticus]MBB5267265.1 putative metal-dependent HD superfamily phosphohydrolase [Algibacter amylolyticus]TSJ82267.1 HD domain-containing protein [Algibacter amylolyticus]
MLIEATEKFVINLLNEKLATSFTYHNITHTQRVVEDAKTLAELCNIDEDNTNLLLIAAWLHDTGYIKGVTNHEDESIKIARAFLEGEKCPEKDIKVICDLILATKLTVAPNNVLEGILRDADCSHVGSKSYMDISELLRKEWELLFNKTFDDIKWLDENIDFLSTKHRFHSPEAASIWDKRKGKNLAKLITTRKKLVNAEKKLTQKKKELKFKKNKIELPERGIETMFRVTLKNHITLSNIADTKANILLSVNAIIISMVLSNLVSKLDNISNHYLIIPTVIFVVFTVISMVLSILATRPNVTRGEFTKEDVANKKVNLLFFGNFHKMSLQDFEWAMGEMMEDRDYLYSSMKKDLYFLGLVLDKKYKILRLTYTVFMIGIIVSVLAFAIAFKYSGVVL